MRNAFRKYLLTICILLLSGYGCSHAISSPDLSGIKTAGIQKNAAHSDFCNAPGVRAVVSAKTLTNRKEAPGIYSEEKEEECNKTLYSRTYTIIVNYFAAFYPKISRDFSFNLKKHLSSCAHWFYASSHRYSALQVIRI